jgi:hypothetical protein
MVTSRWRVMVTALTALIAMLPEVGLRDTPINVRLGSKADIQRSLTDVRFTPESGHWNPLARCPLWAKSRHSAYGPAHDVFGPPGERRHGCGVK